MSTSNKIHLTIDRLERIVSEARKLHESNPEQLSTIVRITETDGEIKLELLTGVSIPQNVEG